MCIIKIFKITLSSIFTIFFASQAFSAENMGAAHPWGLNLREAFFSGYGRNGFFS